MTSSRLLNGAALLCISAAFAATPAWAQNDASTAAGQSPSAATSAAAVMDETPAEVETISVSASRIQIAGYDQPTPVTVLGTAELQRDAKVDIGDSIRQLPSFGISSSPNNSQNGNLVTNGLEGLNLVSLRNLGANRTLILFDGQRVVSSSIQGGVDLNTLPSSLVERVDVVTGGASAAWGSDAVAGVVNVLINKKFTGVSVNLEDSDNFENEHNQKKAEISFGSDLFGDRGHIILSGSISDSPDEFYARETEGFKYQRLVNNPAYVAGNGQPKLIHADYVGLAQATPGGIIQGCTIGGVALTTGCGLRGIYFTGPNGTPGAFNYGNVSNNYYTNGGTQNTDQGNYQLNSFPSRTTTGFALATFKVTDSIKASLQLNYGHFSADSNSYSDIQYGNLAIASGNPYIPASVQQQMTALGVTSLNLGTQLLGNLNGQNDSLAAQQDSLGLPTVHQERNLYRGVFSLDGSLGDNWSWNAYFQHGESRTDITGTNNQQNALLKLAVDAVTVTPANVGASGLPVGSIACRSTLTNPTNGCSPLNVFGTGVASDAAAAYINGVARAGGDNFVGVMTENVGAASMQGTLPFGLEAGKVSTAFGLEYRREEGVQTATPAAQASTFQLGNFKNFFGKYDVKEGFLEFNAPILKDQGVKSLAVDLAGRVTDYSTSGTVETYKLGLVSQVIDDIRLRASYSYDIRAPNLNELFNAGTPVTGAAIDPRTGLGVSIFATTEGNANLKPEKSTTESAGFVLTPRFLPGFNLSLDYYNIDVKEAISSYSQATILAQCAAGNQTFCSDLVFNGPGGALSAILIAPLNSDSETTSGLDLSTDYRTPFLNGAIDVNLVGNYVFELTQTSLGIPTDFASAIGSDSPYLGVPKLRGQVAVTYAQDAWTATVQSRVVGSAHLVSSWESGVDVDNNDIAAVYYLDLRGSYKFDNGIQLYGAIDNVGDRAPPIVAASAGHGSGFESPFRDEIYDGFGRVWRLGIRAKF